MTDLEAYLSALFLREARPVCPDCDVLAEALSADAAAQTAIATHDGARALVSYALAVTGTEHYLDVREGLARDGYRRLFVNGEVRDLDGVRPSEAFGSVEVVVDRFNVSVRQRRRAASALEEAWRRSDGRASVHLWREDRHLTIPAVRGLSCPKCGREFSPPRSGLFSYQSPVGACASCRGFGRVLGIDYRKVVPDDSKSIAERAIRPWNGKKTSWERRVLRMFCEERGIPLDAPWRELSDAQREMVMEGEARWGKRRYPGVRTWFQWIETKSYKMHVRVFLSRYRSYDPCEDCGAKRLSKQALGYRLDGLDLGDWHGLELREARQRLTALELGPGQGALARDELVRRLGYLERVGLGYLTLDRQARTLSGGEAQRVSLTAALGSSLTGALFVLDEPTVGLHPTDLPPLVEAMRELASRGNAVLVVEHDPSVIAAADRVLELGPGAGVHGGRIVYDGPPRADARFGVIARRRRTPERYLTIHGARANNLRSIDVAIPLGVVAAVCGPSGSGKSSLVDNILCRALASALGDMQSDLPGEHDGLSGHESIRRVTLVDQSPLGRTSRGNAATYSGAWTRLRALFAARPEAELRGLTPAHFSFNVAGGRCDACAGEGAETVEMQFLADVRLVCPACQGRRFREEVLDVKLEGKSVADVLAMSVEETLELFAGERAVQRALTPLAELGLGYVALGQPLSTLSGGEAQRLKVARALAEVGSMRSSSSEGSLLLLDEPSAGLHAGEVQMLMRALDRLVAKGASVVVVDHDPALIHAVDWAIELGPGAGIEGGSVVASGPPERLIELATRTGTALTARPQGHARSTPQAHEPAIEVIGAREHNLQSIDVRIPHKKLVVVTGPSGSGKSSLAFDVIFAEGQRRFLETLTPYARQFLPVMPRPEVDCVNGVPPSVALEQRTARAGAGSTVATVTEIAHYLRLLFAKVGVPHCPDCDEPVRATSPDVLFTTLRARDDKLSLRAPVVRARKGVYFDVFSAADRAGIEWAVCDGKLVATDRPPRLAKSKEHSIDFIVYEGPGRALERAAFDRALAFGRGQLLVAPYGSETQSESDELMSATRSCPSCGRAVPELDPRWFSFNTKQGRCSACEGSGFEGGEEVEEVARFHDEDTAPPLRNCRRCSGTRLAPVPRAVRLDGERYHEMNGRSVASLLARAESLRFDGDAARIAAAPLSELLRRLRFVSRVGLDYLTLERRAVTLSGGEMQRLRLAAQLGSGLTGALYVLDEPTIGLHPRDTARLLDNLRELVDTGSTVLVVEHDADTIRAADELIDLGPSGGRGGGRVMAVGPPREVLADSRSPTGRALAAETTLATRRRLEPGDARLVLRGVRANNLRIDELALPAARMVVVAGVSGSGKSTLVGQVLYPAVRRALGRKAAPTSLGGLELTRSIQRALAVDQSPIGRTSRSVPATFLGVWDHMRRLFAATPEARTRGYGPARFSFNSAAGGGRCTTCDGNGVIAHEMAFLPEMKTTCEACGGLRFEPGTLEVKYNGLSIGDVLRLTVDEAVEQFGAHRAIVGPLATLRDLGVGYLQLGQGSPTLSGGEAQRLKLAKELTAGRGHKPTLYVLDEPTTGLHHSDVARLIAVLDRLVQRGDSLVIIEHHPAVIAAADHVVELGPDGGENGGRVVAQGPPDLVAAAGTATGVVLDRFFAPAQARPTSTAAGRSTSPSMW